MIFHLQVHPDDKHALARQAVTKMYTLFLLLFSLLFISNTWEKPSCGGTFTEKHGVIHTPNFPGRFPTPIECEWVIKSDTEGAMIVVYLTQMYVQEGVSFTEKMDYDRRLPGKPINLTGYELENIRHVQSSSNVLVIGLKLNTLENNHVRVLNNFIDVFGFNITYEVTTEGPRKDHCNTMDCGFTGICYDYVT